VNPPERALTDGEARVGRKVFLDCRGHCGCSVRKFLGTVPDADQFEIHSFEPNSEFHRFYPDGVTLHAVAASNADCPAGRRIDLIRWIAAHLTSADHVVLKVGTADDDAGILDRLIADRTIDRIAAIWLERHAPTVDVREATRRHPMAPIGVPFSEWDATLHCVGDPVGPPAGREEYRHHDLMAVARRSVGASVREPLARLGVAKRTPKVVVYSAVFGGTDDFREPKRVNPGCAYVYVSDVEPRDRSTAWTCRVGRRRYRQARRDAKIYKLCPHFFFPDADYSIWLDGMFQIDVDPMDALAWLGGNDIAVFRHPERDCLFDEAEACIRWGLDEPDRIRRQVKAYRAHGYPTANGLIAGGVVVRRHTEAINRLNEAWWGEVLTYSIRDQLSFNYAAWTKHVRYSVIPGDYWRNPYFIHHPHHG
jgi:hypothetical protein